MIAEIISIGSEITSGQNLDTNGQWLSRKLSEIGISVEYHTSVADDLNANIDVFKSAIGRAQIIVATGGLGPTADDLTREVVAKTVGVELVLDRPSLDFIEGLFKSRNREMPERNKIQAYFPAGSIIIPNSRGTAPGIWREIDNKVVICLPGVPREMYAMFDEWVLPKLKGKFGGGRAIVHRVLRCFGAGESHVEEMLGDLTKRGRHPEVGITASAATISLRVTAKASTTEEAEELIEPDAKYIRDKLGDLVFGEGNDELQHVVGKLLIERGTTIATAESCTGGLVSQWLTDTPGISKVFLGGVVAYANQVKEEFLGVPASILETYGAVSSECAESMARGCRERFGTDLGVSVTGIAGPDGGTPEKPVGLVFAGIAGPKGARVVKFNWGGERSFIRNGSAKMALNLIRLALLRGDII